MCICYWGRFQGQIDKLAFQGMFHAEPLLFPAATANIATTSVGSVLADLWVPYATLNCSRCVHFSVGQPRPGAWCLCWHWHIFFAGVPLSHWSSLNHKFKDKILKNFKMAKTEKSSTGPFSEHSPVWLSSCRPSFIKFAAFKWSCSGLS